MFAKEEESQKLPASSRSVNGKFFSNFSTGTIVDGLMSRWINFPSRRSRRFFPAVGVGGKGGETERQE